MERRTNLSYWPIFLHPIFFALGAAMKGKQLHPDALQRMPPVNHTLLAEHRWEVRHVSGEDAKPAGNRYIITITGERIDGQWMFRSGELTSLAREAFASPNVC